MTKLRFSDRLVRTVENGTELCLLPPLASFKSVQDVKPYEQDAVGGLYMAGITAVVARRKLDGSGRSRGGGAVAERNSLGNLRLE